MTSLFIIQFRVPPTYTLFPYTTLFRSASCLARAPRCARYCWPRRWLRPSRGISLPWRSEEHTSELQSLRHLVCRLLLGNKTRDARICSMLRFIVCFELFLPPIIFLSLS